MAVISEPSPTSHVDATPRTDDVVPISDPSPTSHVDALQPTDGVAQHSLDTDGTHMVERVAHETHNRLVHRKMALASAKLKFAQQQLRRRKKKLTASQATVRALRN